MKNKFIFLLYVLFILISEGSNNTGFSRSQLLRDSTIGSMLAPTVQQTFQELKVPGAIIGVWVGSNTPWIATMGVANLETGQPISIDDKMRIGSITKTFTGTVLLQLVDEGKLNLSDKLSQYFPGYPNGQNITINELGNMTSGIFSYSDDTVFVDDILKNMQKAFTPGQLIEISEKHQPNFPPGTSFHYSNTNTILLGLIIEKLTGNSLQSEIQNRILTPLGMKNTTFELNSNFPDPHAHGYFYMDSTSITPIDVTDLNPSWGWSAGAMISTLGDLQQYAKPLATGQLISAKSQEERLKWAVNTMVPSGPWKDKNMRYGFAICDFDGALGHNGGIPGFNSFMGYMTDKDATIIVLVNMQENKAGIGPADYIASKIVEKLKEM